MSIAILRKTAHELRWATLIALFAVTLFPVLIVQAFASVPWEMTRVWLEIPWIASLIRALTGAEISTELSIHALGAFAFVHPVMLTVIWAYVVGCGTRVLCGEIDRGTADIIFALPVSRLRIYASVSVWIFLSCVLLMGGAWLGIVIGNAIADLPERIDGWEMRYVVVNACAMHFAVTGITLLFSAASARRGLAVGVTVATLVVSFLINFLAAMWSPAQSLAGLALLHYFRPFAIVLDGAYQTADIAVLLAIAATTWTAGAIVFTRRDIPSV